MKNQIIGNILKRLSAILKGILMTTGTFATVMIILAFTSAPFWIWYNIGIKKAGINRPPGYIVLLGGGGMPSESGLMRTWYTAGVARYFIGAKIIIALPGDPSDSLSAIVLMKKELIMRGISPNRILLENYGTNTRSQAQNIFKIISKIERTQIVNRKSQIVNRKSQIPNPKSHIVNRKSQIPNPKSPLLLITSPEHLYRAVLTFKKAGFLSVDGLPAFEHAIESDITFDARKLGGRRFIPDIGNFISLRYQFWTQMNYELLIIREYVALGYYKLKGWI